MSGSASAQEWTRRLEEDGAVDFARSWRRVAVPALTALGFIAAGMAMIASDEASTKVTGVLAVAVFSFFLLIFVVQLTAPGPVLRVDRRGMTLGYRTPMTIPWEQVMGVGVYKVSRIASATVAVDTCDQTLDEYARQAPPWIRTLMRLGRLGHHRNTVTIGLVAAPADELADWLDTQVDVHADVPSELILFPLEGVSPVWGGVSLRPVDVSRLQISPMLSGAITDWGRRAAASTGRLVDGEESGTAWANLAEEGRRLRVHLQQELGSGAVVHWFEDGPDGQRPTSSPTDYTSR